MDRFTARTPSLNNDIVRKNLETAIRKKLTEKGLTEATSEPDVSVSYALGSANRTEVERYPARWGGWRRRVAVHYTEGTLTIDMRDPRRQELVWRAIAVVDNQDPNKVQAKLDCMVKKSFDKYPPKKKYITCRRADEFLKARDFLLAHRSDQRLRLPPFPLAPDGGIQLGARLFRSHRGREHQPGAAGARRKRRRDHPELCRSVPPLEPRGPVSAAPGRRARRSHSAHARQRSAALGDAAGRLQAGRGRHSGLHFARYPKTCATGWSAATCGTSSPASSTARSSTRSRAITPALR